MKVEAMLFYKILPTHPEIGLLTEPWDEDKIFVESDTYTFDTEKFDAWKREEVRNDYMKNDLAVIAGGGYATKGIEIVDFKVKEI